MTSYDRRDLGLLLLRLGTGGVLAAHGAQKLFGWFGGHGIEGTGQFMESVGYAPGRASATAAGLAETGGGTLLALGLATPAAGAAAAGAMAGASAVHAPNGFFNTERRLRVRGDPGPGRRRPRGHRPRPALPRPRARPRPSTAAGWSRRRSARRPRSTALVVGLRNRRLRKEERGEQEALFEEEEALFRE